MKLKAPLAVLFLTVFAVSCDQDTPTMPSDDPTFAKGGIPGPPGGQPPGGDQKQEPYEFVYDRWDDSDPSNNSSALGSRCVRMLPESGPIGYGRTFWCDVSDPTFRLKVLDTSTGGPVGGGTVVWKRCERIVDDHPVDWTMCGMLQRGKRAYHGVVFGEDDLPSSGVFEVTLTDWVAGRSVWGMSWAYWDDDKPKPDIETKFMDLACVWYRNAYDGPVWKSCDPPPDP